MKKIFLSLIFLVIIFQASIYVYGQKTDFTLHQILGAPFPSSLITSPNGQQLAWVFNEKGAYNIWWAEGPKFQAQRLTDSLKDSGRSLRLVGFTQKGNSIIFIENSRFNPDQDTDPDQDSGLFKLDIKSKKIIHLAVTENCAFSPISGTMAYTKKNILNIHSLAETPVWGIPFRGRLSFLRWSPDGKSIVAVSNRGEYPHRYSYITLFNLENKTLNYLDASIYQDTRPAWSPDGKKIAFLRRLTSGHQGVLTAKVFPRPDPWEIRIANLETGKTSQVWSSKETDNFNSGQVAWLDNQYLVFSSEANGWRHLYGLLLLNNNKMSQLTRGQFEVESFNTNWQLKKVFLTCNANDIDRRHIWSIDRKGDMRLLTAKDGIQWGPQITGDGKFMAYFGATAKTPAKVYLQPLAVGKAKILAANSFPKNFPKNLVIPKQVIFKASDGWKIHGQLFVPSKKFRGNRPAIMYFHGGPVRQMLLGFHYSSYYHKAYAMNQYLASG